MRIRRPGTRDHAAEPLSDAGPAETARTPAGRRAWNLWELERLAQELNGDTRAEERRLLLLHLRDFADTAGHLPVEFDPLIRDAFGARLTEPVA